MNYQLPALALAAIMLSSLPAVMAAFAQETPTATHLHGCQRYGTDTHCDVLLSDLEGTEVSGNSTLVHPLTSSNTLFVEGKSGQAVELRAEYRESIEIMNVPEVNPEQFSVSFWIKPTRVEPYSHAVSHSNRAQDAGWLFDMFSGGNTESGPAPALRFGVFNSNGTLFSPEDLVLPLNSFVHITGTFDGSTLKLYRDGELAGEAEFSGDYTADPGVPLRVGSGAYCSSCNRLSGAIDDMRMYGRALGDGEVRQIFDMANVTTDGMIGHWKFDGDASDALGQKGGTSTTLLGSMAFAPDGRLFFTEKNSGEIRVMTPDLELIEEPFAGVDDVYVSWEQGLLGIALDPDFDTNHYVYVYYSALADTENGGEDKVVNRLIRFTESNNKGTDMKILMDGIPASRGYHSGGALGFGPDGKLYVTVGDATEHIFAQDPAITLGKVLRINPDGSIPEDNPYPDSPVYTIGHRNMYGIAFGGEAGLITENGDFHYDELNLITENGNYGFPTLQPPNLPPERANNSAIKPLRTYYDAIAPTQMIYYDGDSIPELKGMFLFGSFTGDIYAVRLSDDKKSIVQEIQIDLAHFPFVPTIAIAQSPDGEIYYGGYQIYRLNSVGESEQNVFVVKVDAPPSVAIQDLQVEPESNTLVIDASVSGAAAADAAITTRIPKSLLDGITAVSINGQAADAGDFTVDASDQNYTVVTASAASLPSGDSRLTITGTTVIPEFPVAALVMAVAVLAGIAATTLAAKRQRFGL